MKKQNTRKNKQRRSKKALFISFIVEILVVLVILAVVFWDKGLKSWLQSLETPVLHEVDISGIYSRNAVLMQAKGAKVLGASLENEQIYPASMTKMMTAIVSIEELDSLDEEITLTTAEFDGLGERDATRAGFEPGETVSARHLLYGVLLPSGAECCIALADHIAGSEAAFVEMMNAKARKLGMTKTHFCDTTGLHDPDHYSTVFDMATLLRYCIKNDDFREIIESPWHYTGPTNVHPDGITFYSTLFNNVEDPHVTEGILLGGKTGFTNEAGLCLASYARIGGQDYIFVTAGAPAGTGNPLHVEDAMNVYERVGIAWAKLTGAPY